MMLGIGLYAPCMILVSLLGMNPTAAFPIMMGSCAFLMPVSSVRFVRAQTYDVRAALGLALGGLPAALIAAKLVESLPLYRRPLAGGRGGRLHGAEHAAHRPPGRACLGIIATELIGREARPVAPCDRGVVPYDA